MKNSALRRLPSQALTQKNSEKLLMAKMGISRHEMKEIHVKYGVPASKLLELMQLSKYEFTYNGRIQGQCEPCIVLTKMKALN